MEGGNHQPVERPHLLNVAGTPGIEDLDAFVRPDVGHAAFVTLVLLATLHGNYDYIVFAFRQKTPALRLPMSVVFSAFGVFMVLQIGNGAVRLYRASRPDWEQQP